MFQLHGERLFERPVKNFVARLIVEIGYQYRVLFGQHGRALLFEVPDECYGCNEC